MSKIEAIFLNFFCCFPFFLFLDKLASMKFLSYYDLPIVLWAFGYPIGWKEVFFGFIRAFVIFEKLSTFSSFLV